MKLRVWIWTIGLAYVGYALASKSASPQGTWQFLGTLIGAVVGFGVGWGLQRLLELGRRH